ncbi:hypothetical protein PMAYCL1PPCAC_19212, partial [Pristionchus mayeri]
VSKEELDVRELSECVEVGLLPVIGHEIHGRDGSERHHNHSLSFIDPLSKLLFERLGILALDAYTSNVNDLRKRRTSEIVELVRVH